MILITKRNRIILLDFRLDAMYEMLKVVGGKNTYIKHIAL